MGSIFVALLPAVDGFAPEALLRHGDAELDVRLGVARARRRTEAERDQRDQGRCEEQSWQSWPVAPLYRVAIAPRKRLTRSRSGSASNAVYHGESAGDRPNIRAGSGARSSDAVLSWLRRPGHVPIIEGSRGRAPVAQAATGLVVYTADRAPLLEVAHDRRTSSRSRCSRRPPARDARARRSALELCDAPTHSSCSRLLARELVTPPRLVDPRACGRSSVERALGITAVALDGRRATPRGSAGNSGPAGRALGRRAVRPLEPPRVAVVGSRARRPAGLEVAERLGHDLAAAGVTVVSGLARGCDAARPSRGPRAGGATIAVLGCGPDIGLSGRARAAATADRAQPGARHQRVSAGTPPLPHHFPLRNRIISGLSLGGHRGRGLGEERVAHHGRAVRSNRAAKSWPCPAASSAAGTGAAMPSSVMAPARRVRGRRARRELGGADARRIAAGRRDASAGARTQLLGG